MATALLADAERVELGPQPGPQQRFADCLRMIVLIDALDPGEKISGRSTTLRPITSAAARHTVLGCVARCALDAVEPVVDRALVVLPWRASAVMTWLRKHRYRLLARQRPGMTTTRRVRAHATIERAGFHVRRIRPTTNRTSPASTALHGDNRVKQTLTRPDARTTALAPTSPKRITPFVALTCWPYAGQTSDLAPREISTGEGALAGANCFAVSHSSNIA